MKVLNVVFSLILTTTAFSQVDCSAYKTGKFVVRSEEYGDNFIKRTKKYQIETGMDLQTGKKIRTKDKVVWIDECTYQLLPVKSKNMDDTMRGVILTFRIIETGDDYYMVHISGIEGFEIRAKVERQ